MRLGAVAPLIALLVSGDQEMACIIHVTRALSRLASVEEYKVSLLLNCLYCGFSCLLIGIKTELK